MTTSLSARIGKGTAIPPSAGRTFTATCATSESDAASYGLPETGKVVPSMALRRLAGVSLSTPSTVPPSASSSSMPSLRPGPPLTATGARGGAAAELPVMTLRELQRHDGSSRSGGSGGGGGGRGRSDRVLVSVKGRVLDVTRDEQGSFSPPSPMVGCRGHDATLVFAKGSFDAALLDRSWAAPPPSPEEKGQREEERRRLEAYVKILTARFPTVASLAPADVAALTPPAPRLLEHGRGSSSSSSSSSRGDVTVPLSPPPVPSKKEAAAVKPPLALVKSTAAATTSAGTSFAVAAPDNHSNADDEEGRSGVALALADRELSPGERSFVAAAVGRLQAAVDAADVAAVRTALSLTSPPPPPPIGGLNERRRLQRLRRLVANGGEPPCEAAAATAAAAVAKEGLPPLHRAVLGFSRWPKVQAAPGDPYAISDDSDDDDNSDDDNSNSNGNGNGNSNGNGNGSRRKKTDTRVSSVAGPSRSLAIVHALLRAGADRGAAAPYHCDHLPEGDGAMRITPPGAGVLLLTPLAIAEMAGKTTGGTINLALVRALTPDAD
jgi:hypothetical protein